MLLILVWLSINRKNRMLRAPATTFLYDPVLPRFLQHAIIGRSIRPNEPGPVPPLTTRGRR
jgi:hypothetical protein